MKFNTLSKCSIILCFNLFSLLAQAELKCGPGKLRMTYLGEEKMIIEEFCTNSLGTVLMSASCIKKKCSAFQSEIKINLSGLYSERGTPGFHLCRQMHGTPQIVNILINHRWQRLDRCLFQKDQSYVDTGSLIAHYLK